MGLTRSAAPLRTAVIGAGVVAENNHLPALARNPQTELVAVCDADRETVREAAADYDVRAYDDAELLLDREDLDWVHVATPVGTHAALAEAAVEAGVPVLLQKPATTNLDELEALTALADERGVPLSVVHNWLYYPAVRALRERVDRGDVGALRAVEVTVTGEGRPDETYRGDWVFDLPGGAFGEGLPHPLYLALGVGGYPLDEDAVDVRTRLAGEYDREVDYDGLQVGYTTADDALCSVTYLSGAARGTSLRVHGDDGSLSVDLPTSTVEFRDDEAGPYHFWNERFGANAARARATVEGTARNLLQYAREYVEDEFDLHLNASPDGHYHLIDEAARALHEGRSPPRDVEESYWTLLLTERVREEANR